MAGPSLREINQIIEYGRSLISSGHSQREALSLMYPRLEGTDDNFLIEALVMATGLNEADAQRFAFHERFKPQK